MERKPKMVRTDGLDPEIVAELERAFDQELTVEFSGEYWLVQKLEEHLDPGAGRVVTTFELIPAEAPGEER